MSWLRDRLSRLAGDGPPDLERIDQARIALRDPEFTPLLAKDHEVEAVRRLRKRVRGLGLLDAVRLVRERREGHTP